MPSPAQTRSPHRHQLDLLRLIVLSSTILLLDQARSILMGTILIGSIDM
jgi:hypothetical protein